MCKPVKVRASETYINKDFEVIKKVKVEGKEIEFKVRISYQKDNSQLSEKTTSIELADENLYFDSENNRYCIINDSINYIKGKIVGSISDISSMEYHICDTQGTRIKAGEIEVSEIWKIDNIGLIIGENIIYVKALTI